MRSSPAADRVLIMGHKLGDVDCFGAAIGIYRIARALDRRAQIVINDITTSVQPLIEMFQNNREYEPDMFLKSQQAIETAESNTVLNRGGCEQAEPDGMSGAF